MYKVNLYIERNNGGNACSPSWVLWRLLVADTEVRAYFFIDGGKAGHMSAVHASNADKADDGGRSATVGPAVGEEVSGGVAEDKWSLAERASTEARDFRLDQEVDTGWPQLDAWSFSNYPTFC